MHDKESLLLKLQVVGHTSNTAIGGWSTRCCNNVLQQTES